MKMTFLNTTLGEKNTSKFVNQHLILNFKMLIYILTKQKSTYGLTINK